MSTFTQCDFYQSEGECVDFSKNILDTVDFSQSHLVIVIFANVRLEIQTSIIVTLRFALHQSRVSVCQRNIIYKSNLTAVMFDYVRMSTGNFKIALQNNWN